VNESFARLVHVLGTVRGQSIYEDTLAAIGRTSLLSPDDEIRFADALIANGGLLESIGRSLRVRALLRGAKRVS